MTIEIPINVDNVKRMYNWFYHGFEDFENNESCSPEDIMLMKKLERWLIYNGE
jgi:hypothetical protein